MSRRSIRCAIYTRKSSEEGLEQGFNSLHAQREACEAYILSQAGEGWMALKTQYDDGGVSGGTMERPGLKKLLEDVDRGLIDVVVVYKVDRLTRSLNDFARIVEAFDGKSVSFVSVTQAFNTTSSMGRLTLNVLLSFAQFEREVTGERIRDKIAASKRKGMWMGGNLPLGYDAPTDLQTRSLVVNSNEAEVVRLIFQRYLALKSVHRLRDELERNDIRSKSWISTRGNPRGGLVLARGALFHILRNRVYLGDIVHRGVTSATGAHPPIIDQETFDKVQALLRVQAAHRGNANGRVSSMPLKGKVFDTDGRPMTPVFTRRGRNKVYRYYVSAPLQQGGRSGDGAAGVRLPAAALEGVVGEALTRLSGGRAKELAKAEIRVDVLDGRLRITCLQALLVEHAEVGGVDAVRKFLNKGEAVSAVGEDSDSLQISIPCRLMIKGGRVWITNADGITTRRVGAIDRALVKGLRQAHELLARTAGSAFGRPELAVLDASTTDPYQRKLIRLAFLAPDIQAQILEGRHPPALTLQSLVMGDIPASWDEQRRVLGIAA